MRIGWLHGRSVEVHPDGERWRPLSPILGIDGSPWSVPDPGSLVAEGPWVALGSEQLGPPVPRPGKIVGCLGNVGGGDGFDLFVKAPSSVVGPDGVIRVPLDGGGDPVDVAHECELAVVIGRGGSGLRQSEVLRHVAGCTIGLDLAASGPGERSRRKSHDTFCPLGPWVVTTDELDPFRARRVRLWVDGALRQDGSTADLVLGVAEAIARVSAAMRLDPGDVVLTGAPPRTGVLRPGQRVEAEIEGIGRLALDVVAGSAHG